MQNSLIQEITLQGIILGSSVILGMTGFGNAMIALPLMLFFMDPKLAIPVMVGLSLFSQFTIQAIGRFPIDWKLLWLLAIPASIGTFIGANLQNISEPGLLIDIVGIIIIVFALASLIGLNIISLKGRIAAIVIGLIAGVLGGVAALAGPPVVLYLSEEQAQSKLAFRGTILAFFTIVIMTALISYFILGMLNFEHLILIAKLIPAMLIGVWVGIRLIFLIGLSFLIVLSR
jgi:uncharacterized membrane protein YfcA